jgi:hypothetical protein
MLYYDKKLNTLHFHFQFLYKYFYKHGSGNDRGTLCQLRNVLNRVNVSGADAVTQNFRLGMSFIFHIQISSLNYLLVHLCEYL